jgi:3-isopropylmalate/(R)-2-methylmalate dehydratase large subunit
MEMGKTITEKIFEKHLIEGSPVAGNFVLARVDLVLMNDITAPPAIAAFEKIGVESVFDRSKIALVPDHFTPNKDIESAMNVKMMRDFAARQAIENYFEVGRGGVEHALLPEKGLTLPGMLIVGADSHTCTYGAVNAFATGVGSTDAAYSMALGELWFKVPETIRVNLKGHLNPWVTGKDIILKLIGMIGVDGARYKALEFGGPLLKELSMDSRFTIANMAIEAGAKAGILEPDETLATWVDQFEPEPEFVYPDADAIYERVIELDASDIDLQVAFPHLPSNTRNVSEIKEKIYVDQVFIGSCTNGRIEDLRIAAHILKGKKVAERVRLIIIPATQEIYKQALKEGLIEIFLEAGAAIGTPTCGPCLGGHHGILAKGEKALSTSNRNFLGRMGHKESEVYLAGPAVAAATAVAGYITSPSEIL